MLVNIFKLAIMQIIKDGKDPTDNKLLLEYAVKIRKFMDKHREKTVNRILQGDRVYQYAGQIKTYSRA